MIQLLADFYIAAFFKEALEDDAIHLRANFCRAIGRGARTLEYNRQPAGHRNYMITIGADGKMSALRQVLTPQNFARVHAGMGVEDVRRMLGKPARQVPYALKNETVWTWKFLEPPSDKKAFNVYFGPDMRVQRTEIGTNPDGPDGRGGG